MKAPKIMFAAAAALLSVSAYSQQTSGQPDKTENNKRDSAVSSWGTYPKTTTATDTSTVQTQAQMPGHQTFPAPNFGTYYIPVLGSYTSSENNTSKTITISGDEKNIGKVWIEGLAPVKIYALLKAVPGTYKIPSQTQDQKKIHEGTLVYDEANKQVSICVGCGYKDPKISDVPAQNQASVNGKNKNAVITFTGVKTDNGTASTY